MRRSEWQPEWSDMQSTTEIITRTWNPWYKINRQSTRVLINLYNLKKPCRHDQEAELGCVNKYSSHLIWVMRPESMLRYRTYWLKERITLKKDLAIMERVSCNHCLVFLPRDLWSFSQMTLGNENIKTIWGLLTLITCRLKHYIMTLLLEFLEHMSR